MSTSDTSEFDVAHAVINGREITVQLQPDKEARFVHRGRFSNTLQSESLDRIRRVVEIACGLDRPVETLEILRLAEASADQKGVLGALRILDADGRVHALSGGRRVLIWCPGRRPSATPLPRAVHHARYSRLSALLRANNHRWHSTDWLVVEAGFDRDLVRGIPMEQTPRRQRGLPVNFFHDSGKSARKYVLGALKAMYWLECVAWRQHTRQAIEWTWVAAREGRVLIPPIPLEGSARDPYLSDKATMDRGARVAEHAEVRAVAFEEARQRWIEEHYPEAALHYHLERARRERARQAAMRHAVRLQRDVDVRRRS